MAIERVSIKNFVIELEKALNRKDGYIMGSRGQNPKKWATNSWWYTQYSGKQKEKALYWREHAERVWDCNGMSEGIYEDFTGVNINTKARFNYAEWCDPKGTGMIPAQYRVPGAAVFWSGTTDKPGKAGDIHHVAYLYKPVDDSNTAGDWYIIEARGVMYGVVKTKLYDRKPDFWGWMTKYYDYEAEPVPVPEGLKRGNKGEEVKKVQNQLLSLGYSLPKYGADSDFGAETETAVKMFQKDNGLSETGIVDEATKKLLDERTTTVKNDYEITGGSVWIWTLPPNCGGEKQEVLHKGDQCGKPDVGDYLPIMWNGKMAWVNKKYVKEA